jgi:hypothetical protein
MPGRVPELDWLTPILVNPSSPMGHGKDSFRSFEIYIEYNCQKLQKHG